MTKRDWETIPDYDKFPFVIRNSDLLEGAILTPWMGWMIYEGRNSLFLWAMLALFIGGWIVFVWMHRQKRKTLTYTWETLDQYRKDYWKRHALYLGISAFRFLDRGNDIEAILIAPLFLWEMGSYVYMNEYFLPKFQADLEEHDPPGEQEKG